MKLSDRDYQTIVEALDIAAEQYERDGFACGRVNQPRTAEHFRELRKRAMTLAEQIREEIGL